MSREPMMPPPPMPEAWRPARGRQPGGIQRAVALLLTVGLVGGALYAHGRLSRRPLWTIGAVEVEGNRSIGTAELMERLHMRPGMPWWKANLRSLPRLQAEEPRIASIRVAWSWPRDLRITVRERESVLRVLVDPPLELSADCVLLDPVDALDPADLPFLTGPLPVPLRPGQSLALGSGSWWRTLQQVREGTPQLWKSISEVHWEGGTHFQVFLRDGRRVILWDDGVNPQLWGQIPRILEDLRRQRIEDAVLDLRFRKQVVVRLPETEAGGEEPPADAPRSSGSAGAKGQAHGRRRA